MYLPISVQNTLVRKKICPADPDSVSFLTSNPQSVVEIGAKVAK